MDNSACTIERMDDIINIMEQSQSGFHGVLFSVQNKVKIQP